jgi:hypothetical protein
MDAGVKRVGLGRVLPFLSGEHPVAQGQGMREDGLQSLIACDLALDVADHAPKIDLERP